jgi:hypothetical protein
MNREDDAGRGIALAQSAIHAIADGDDGQALALLNAGTHAETAWAAAYLLQCLREAVAGRVKGNPGKLRRALHVAAQGAEGDAIVTRVGLIVDDAERGGSDG